MWAFLASECLLFGALISTFLLYRNRPVTGLTPQKIYDIPFTSVSSFVLLMSSLTMVLALAAIQRGDHGKLRVWLMATALLGMTFISGQVYEFTRFVQAGLTVRTNLFGTSFFILTGFHGAHVTGGILMLLTLFGMFGDGQGDRTDRDRPGARAGRPSGTARVRHGGRGPGHRHGLRSGAVLHQVVAARAVRGAPAVLRGPQVQPGGPVVHASAVRQPDLPAAVRHGTDLGHHRVPDRAGHVRCAEGSLAPGGGG